MVCNGMRMQTVETVCRSLRFPFTRLKPGANEKSGRVLETQNMLESSQVLNRQWTQIHAKNLFAFIGVHSRLHSLV
jgi:hypothetical protein